MVRLEGRHAIGDAGAYGGLRHGPRYPVDEVASAGYGKDRTLRFSLLTYVVPK